jgi:hypothetical protein
MMAVGQPDQAARRSWFAIDGGLEPIDHRGPSFFRFPEALAESLIDRFSEPGDWVLDPFCGFGTTLVVAERRGRTAVGFEADPGRAAFAASRIAVPGRVVNARSEAIKPGPWPPFKLLLTSPPYGSFRDDAAVDDIATYLGDAERLFAGFVGLLSPAAIVAVEVSQVRNGERTRPLVWHLGQALARRFMLREDIVRINTGSTEAGPGYNHSHILIFALR